MTALLRAFIEMDRERQTLYQVGRWLGLFSRIGDMDDPRKAARAERACHELGITPDNADRIIGEIMTRFI